jgi:glycosyltransferase involved in cell wall biosynthesis
MRILAVGNMYPPHHDGGYELEWQAAMRRARAVGHEPRILASDHRKQAAGGEEDPDVHRTLRWYWNVERYEFQRLGLAQRIGLERHNWAVLNGHLDQFQPDIVAWWSMGCMSLSLIERVRRAGLPAVFLVHDDWLVYGWQHDAWIRIWRGRRRSLAPIAERLCGLPTRVDAAAAGPFVFNSQYTLRRACKTGLGSASTTIVHPGIDERYLQALAPQPWQWRLAYVGRIDRHKGVDTAVRALAQLPKQATLAVWGTGDDRFVAEMRALATALGVADRVRFNGFAGPDELRGAYAEADVVVFPVRWEEPFGLVPLEAMGLGRPVVTTARGGTAEFVRNGENALVFTADRPQELAACVQRLARERELRARLREGGRRTAAQYTEARFAQRTIEEIERAAGWTRAANGAPAAAR